MEDHKFWNSLSWKIIRIHANTGDVDRKYGIFTKRKIFNVDFLNIVLYFSVLVNSYRVALVRLAGKT